LEALQGKHGHVLVQGNFRSNGSATQNGFYHRGWMNVVEQRGHAIEPYGSKQLFMVEGTVGLSKDRMALRRNRSEFVIKRHSTLNKNQNYQWYCKLQMIFISFLKSIFFEGKLAKFAV
jgi:hypothetical protein